MDAALSLLAIFFVAAAAPGAAGAVINLVDRGEPIRFTATGASRFFREWGAHLLQWAMLPLGSRDPGPSPGDWGRPGRPPVMLVPGYGMNRACLFFLATYLRRRGWEWVWPVNNRPHSAGVPVYASRLAEAVARLRRETGAEQVDIVGHSMGGVIAAWYINQLGGHAHVRRLITLGTPGLGTRMHVFGTRHQARDMAPGAPVIAEIQGPQVEAVSLWSRFDPLISPPEAATPPGVRAVEIGGAGHLEMLTSAAAFRAVRDALLEGEADPTPDPQPDPTDLGPEPPTELVAPEADAATQHEAGDLALQHGADDDAAAQQDPPADPEPR